MHCIRKLPYRPAWIKVDMVWLCNLHVHIYCDNIIEMYMCKLKISIDITSLLIVWGSPHAIRLVCTHAHVPIKFKAIWMVIVRHCARIKCASVCLSVYYLVTIKLLAGHNYYYYSSQKKSIISTEYQ